jgi:hypothetical protein
MMQITKSSGQKESFQEEKLYNSIRSAGIEHSLAQEVLRMVVHDANNLTDTAAIHHTTESVLLKHKQFTSAVRYNIQRSIMDLGPSGYPFEQYIARVLQEYGYTTTTNRIMWGRCVKHEIDVVAKRDNHHYMIECKHHHYPGAKADIKIALYIYARFLDVKDAWEKQEGKNGEIHVPWLVTNTKITTDVIQYAECVGMKVLAWRYPQPHGLNYFIEAKKLYPVTAVSQLTVHQKSQLLKHNIILLRDILHYSTDQLSQIAALRPSLIQHIQSIAQSL